ncbi:hypothetical protein, partial [Pseudomonas savastanoi]|uniref:hypothetical protein n=1 Tax=Pseudomonas savastanoi TaxID=29438 RepID=UPI001C81B7F6
MDLNAAAFIAKAGTFFLVKNQIIKLCYRVAAFYDAPELHAVGCHLCCTIDPKSAVALALTLHKKAAFKERCSKFRPLPI